MMPIGPWFQELPTLDCTVKQHIVRLLQIGERTGITARARDIRVAVADWLDDVKRNRTDERPVLVVLVYRMEDGSYTALSTQPLVGLEKRHADNLLLRSI